MKHETQQRIEELAVPVCRQLGCELFLVEYIRAGRNSILRVYIDKEGGVTVGDCQRVSEAISVELDVEDVIPQRYHLEVSSPGLNRPIRGPEDFVRYVGRKVRVVARQAPETGGQTTFIGRLVAYDNETATIESPKGHIEIPQKNIKRANLEYEMG
jgi:ribosome maturation factor RimP